MRRRLNVHILLGLLLCSLSLSAQQGISMASLLPEDPALVEKANGRIAQLKENLGSPSVSNDRVFLQRIFKQTHRQFLRKYKAYSEFKEVFASGNYDCLTATALFSHLLGEYNFSFSLIETNYHIFLVVHSLHGDVLIETTDKVNGFVTDEEEIKERIGGYRQNQLTASADPEKKIYAYHVNLYRELTAAQLPGLLYFNQAIRSFNNNQWAQCASYLEKAREVYDTPRIEELASILLRAVYDHEQDEVRKKEIISRLRQYFVSKTVAGL